MHRFRERKALYTAIAVIAVLLAVLAAAGIGFARAQLITSGKDAANEIKLGMSQLNVRVSVNNLLVGQDGNMFSARTQDIDPGKKYAEKIAAANGSMKREFVRMIVRKYWQDDNGKRADLDPAMIHLSYGDDEGNSAEDSYNTAAWLKNDAESTREQTVYYLKKSLQGKQSPEDRPVVIKNWELFDGLTIRSEIADAVSFSIDEKTNTITAEYAYEGATFVVEAEVQSIQFEHAEDAAASAWGVPNVSISDGEIHIG